MNTPPWQPLDPNFASRVRASFDRQVLMHTIGAAMTHTAPGEIEIVLPFRADLTQQHGYLHAAVATAIMDSACGYAAMTLTGSDTGVLTVEYKVNFMRPALGDRIRATARVLRAGRSITVCAGDVVAESAGEARHVATMIATIANVTGRPERGQ